MSNKQEQTGQQGKIYKFRDSEYIMLPLNFETLKYAAPLQMAYNKAFNKMMSDVDMTPVENRREEIAELTRDYSKIERLIKTGDLSKSVKQNKQQLLKELKEKIESESEAFLGDSKIRSLLKIQDGAHKNAMNATVTEKDDEGNFITWQCIPLIVKVVKGEFNLNFTDIDSVPELIQFVKAVVRDFFILTSPSLN